MDGFMGPDTGKCESSFSCPLYADKPENRLRSSCRCNAGYTGPNMWGPCVACVAGTFKEFPGSAACEFCVPESISPIGSAFPSACLCNVGFQGPSGETCRACEVGKYKDVIGSNDYSSCPRTTVSPVGSTVLTACTCNVGYTGVFLPKPTILF